MKTSKTSKRAPATVKGKLATLRRVARRTDSQTFRSEAYVRNFVRDFYRQHGLVMSKLANE